jgi:pectate lyase
MSKLFIAVSGLFLLVACGKDPIENPAQDASPGTTAAGGAQRTGGAIGTGGSVGSGGAAATGGASATGGRMSTGMGGATSGGHTGTGDGSGGRTSDAAVASGGRTANDGSTGTGGSAATGGVDAGPALTGGTMGTGGRLGTGGATGAGGSSGTCTSPPEPSPLVGWAAQSGGGVATTTGGGNAAPVTVTSLGELQAAVKGTTAAVIYVKGVMAAGVLSIGSNKTIVGLCGAEIHGHVGLSGSTNVIIRNLKLVGYAVGNCALDPGYDASVGCSSGEDAISVGNNAHHIWFDHCDISDGTDGNLDITQGADFVTVSWTKFHYTPRTDNGGSDSTGAAGHRYSNLVGGSDNNSIDVGKLNITWHHNWWADNVMERQPRVRYGKNHILNNLYSAAGNNYCVRAGMDAQILVEANVFSGVKNPQVFNSTADQTTAYITSKNNVYTGTSGTQATGGGGTPFETPPYTYTADATSGLQAAIQSGAGPK